MGFITQIVILLIVLACMVMVLLAIRQLSHYKGFDDTEETVNLKKEIEEDGHILSQNSIFSTLVEAEPDEKEKLKHYRSNSKEPFSRNE